MSYSNDPGASARFEFDGTAFEYVYTKAFNRGLALVTIDGVERGIVDLYARPIQWQATTAFGGLMPGHHTVEIQVLGRRNSVSSSSYIDIDALAGQ